MDKYYFITGTDTDAGKTFCCSAMLRAAAKLGISSLGLKPVAAGCSPAAAGLRNDDALLLMAHSTVALPYEQINPIALQLPVAPHIAAARDNIELSVTGLCDLLKPGLDSAAEFTLIEGAGGWMVPLNEEETLSDLAAALQIPVVLVVGMKLGCINHALLTVAAIQAQGLNLAGWIANCVDTRMSVMDENIATLKRQISAPCLGVVPYLQNPDGAEKYIDISILV